MLCRRHLRHLSRTRYLRWDSLPRDRPASRGILATPLRSSLWDAAVWWGGRGQRVWEGIGETAGG